MTNVARATVQTTDNNGISAQPSTARLEDRYALALYELAATQNAVDKVEQDVATLLETVTAAADLQRALKSPVISRSAIENTLAALSQKLGLSELTQNFVRLVARKGRAGRIAIILAAFRAECARRRGEVTAKVVSASALTDAQQENLRSALSAQTGARVQLDITIDPSLLGGLTVKIGSRLYDRSLQSQLARLQKNLQQAA